jgi:hypothetical protein
MAFWTDYGNFEEPKRAYRFRVYFGQEFQLPWVAKSVSKPSFSVSETKHSYLNHNFYYPGRVEWSTVSMTLVDPGDPDMAQILQNMMWNSGYVVPSSDTPEITLSKGSSIKQMQSVKIQQIQNAMSGEDIDGTQVEVIEEWVLQGAWIKDIKYGDLSYEDDNMTEISVELRYDYATLNKEGSIKRPVGQNKRDFEANAQN